MLTNTETRHINFGLQSFELSAVYCEHIVSP